MKCIDIDKTMGSEPQLRLIEHARPEPQIGQALIKVAYAGVNRPDILQRRGLYPPPHGASPIIGLEVSGTIESLSLAPDQSCGFKLGDEVCALVNGGGYAQYVAVDIGQILPIPKGLGLKEAASLPEVAITVTANLLEHGAYQSGEKVLIHGANSGISSFAIQLAAALGAKVYATARGELKCAYAKSLGADKVIDTQKDDFAEILQSDQGADVILDIVGGDYVARNIMALAFRGRLVQIGVPKGDTVEISLRHIMRKQAIITGSMLRPRSSAEKTRLCDLVLQRVWPLIEVGLIHTHIEQVFDFKDAQAAHDYLDQGTHLGKVVLKIH